MKIIQIIICAALISVTAAVGSESSEADQRWIKAVEQKIASGPTTITTPSETRAKLAESLARKQRRLVIVTKTDSGFSIQVRETEVTEK